MDTNNYMEPAAEIDELDEKILKLITQNARIPFLEVERECGVSGAAIHQRVQRLMNIGVLSGSERSRAICGLVLNVTSSGM